MRAGAGTRWVPAPAHMFMFRSIPEVGAGSSPNDAGGRDGSDVLEDLALGLPGQQVDAPAQDQHGREEEEGREDGRQRAR